MRMTSYITLLRSVNVSGKNLLKMDVFRQLMHELGFHQIQTYIQSGNLIFQSAEQDTHLLSQQIHDTLATHLGLDIIVFTFSLADFQQILEQNPFQQESELAQLYIAFFDTTPDEQGLLTIHAKKLEGEQLHYTKEAIYLIATQGYGKTKITPALLEQKLRVKATTRNYNTCSKLLEMVNGEW